MRQIPWPLEGRAARRQPTTRKICFFPVKPVSTTAGHLPSAEAGAKRSPARICLLGASLTTGNLGVSALASGTVASVLSTFPDAQVFLLEYDREPSKHVVYSQNGTVEVELVNIRFSKRLFLRNNIARLLVEAFFIGLLPKGRWQRSLLNRNPYFRRILECDVIASIAGGDSFSDIYGLPRLLYMALPQLLVLQLGKPLVLLPQTLGPFRGAGAKMIARYIMRRATVVYARDRTSLAEAGRLLGAQPSQLRFSYDMAFMLAAVKPPAAKLRGLPLEKGGGPLIGINVSGLLLMGGYTHNNMFGLKTDYACLMREIIGYFVREHQANVLLVPHVFGDDPESDVRACAGLFKELHSTCHGRLFMLPGNFNQHEIKYVIGQCDFFVGSRMHACIAALSQSVPAACLAYSRKFAGVMASIGAERLVIDLRECEAAKIMALIEGAYAAREDLQSQLTQTMPAIKQTVAGLFAQTIPRGPAAAVYESTPQRSHVEPDPVKSGIAIESGCPLTK